MGAADATGREIMKVTLRLSLALALVSPIAMPGALAARAPDVVSEQARTVAGGRPLQVLVVQSEIKSDINPSNLMIATGGGLLGAVLQASQNASRAKKAEAAIAPVRDALVGFDAEGLALATTKKAVGEIGWLQPTAITLGKDSSPLGKSAILDGGGASQAAFVAYTYDLSPDFSSVRVVARLEFANKALPVGVTKPEARVSPKYLAYEQAVTAIVSLPNPSKDINANAALWAADGARAARTGITLAFAEVGRLLPRTFALSAADIKQMRAKDKPKKTAGGFSGRVQASDASGDLLWANGFISARQLPSTL